MTEKQLTARIVEYFETFIFKNHIEASLKKNAKLKSYKINPIVVKYLSKVLEGDYTAEGVASIILSKSARNFNKYVIWSKNSRYVCRT